MRGSRRRVSCSLSVFGLGLSGPFGAHWTLKGRGADSGIRNIGSDWGRLLIHFLHSRRYNTESNQKGPAFTSECEHTVSTTSWQGDLEHAAQPLRAPLSSLGTQGKSRRFTVESEPQSLCTESASPELWHMIKMPNILTSVVIWPVPVSLGAVGAMWLERGGQEGMVAQVCALFINVQ